MKDETTKMMPQIEAERTEVEEVITSIEKTIHELNTHFHGVLRKVPDPQPGEKGAIIEKTEEEIVPLAHALRLFKKRLRFINDDILDIINRCEL